MDMNNITLIGTRHEEGGVCTSDELYKIFEVIKPDVIFEEIPPSYFDKYYVTRIRRNLESDTVLKYMKSHIIQHIPVDSDDIPIDSFFKDLEYLHKCIERLSDINGLNYRRFSDKNSEYIRRYGFLYANSIYSITIQEEIQNSIEKGLQVINNEKLNQVYETWLEINEKRENEMLRNIYDYSKENAFDNAVFMLGFGHRKSIMQKILVLQKTSGIRMNWIYYSDKYKNTSH